MGSSLIRFRVAKRLLQKREKELNERRDTSDVVVLDLYIVIKFAPWSPFKYAHLQGLPHPLVMNVVPLPLPPFHLKNIHISFSVLIYNSMLVALK